MMGCLLLSSGMACYSSEECTSIVCSDQGLLGCKVGAGYLVLYEGVSPNKIFDSLIKNQITPLTLHPKRP